MNPDLPPLGRKQSSDHADWLRVWSAIRLAPDHGRAQALVSGAAERLARFSHGRRVAYGWSGGKDSLALQAVAEAAGLTRSVLVVSCLEFPAFSEWVERHAPEGLTTEVRANLDLDWLAAHPEMLFPRQANVASRWFALTQHAGQRAYAKRTDLDVLVLGRRRADGNYLGKQVEPGSYAYLDRGGFTRFSPIADWSHEDVLHVIAAYGLAMPPIYDWPRGFRVGTGPWPARQGTADNAQGWRETYAIDPSIVRLAAEADLPNAREALTLLESSATPRPKADG